MKQKLKFKSFLATFWTPKNSEEGIALIITLLALTIFTALGGTMFFSSVTEVRISDNYESHLKARQAALGGINHARELLRGVDFNDLLQGPDGTYNNNSSYLAVARTADFRNPLTWDLARTLNITNPLFAVQTLQDDGLFNTGKAGTIDGTILIPLTGIAQTSTDPYRSGTIFDSRYFVKVSDNNGEASELAGDPADNPFVDGDNIIIVRSMGVSRTIAENSGGLTRANSTAVYEARFRRSTTFDTNAPLVVEGDDILPSAPGMFDGNSFRIEGGNINYGIATIDPDPNNGDPLPDQIDSYLDPNQDDNIRGIGGTPSLADITASLTSPDQLLLMDPNYLYRFVTEELPRIADSYYQGDQMWSGGNAPYLGSYDIRKHPNDPSQHPMVTYVDGDLDVQGNLSGGGLLVVRGAFGGGGTFNFDGLILILGEGDLNFSGLNVGINGGIFIANLQEEEDGSVTFGTPKITIAGRSVINVHANSLSVARRLLPLQQLGQREITSRTDP